MKEETESLLKLASADLLSERGETQQKRPRQLEKKCINWDAFHRTATLNLQTLRHVLHNNNNFTQEFINDCFEHLEKCLHNTTLHCRIENRLPVLTVCNLQPPLNISQKTLNKKNKINGTISYPVKSLKNCGK